MARWRMQSKIDTSADSSRAIAFPISSGQNDFVSLFECDDRLFPIGGLAGLSGALAAIFAADIQRVYASDLDLE